MWLVDSMNQHRHSASFLQALVAFISGCLFGFGLIFSQMVDANKVLNFLDFFGQWDPSLAIVMGAALTVFSIGYALLVNPNTKPLLDDQFFIPSKNVSIKSY
jgi:uncharacterized membrane protein YedE/YeeE